MSKLEIIFTFFLLIFLPSLIQSQSEIEEIYINDKKTLSITSEGKLYKLVVRESDLIEKPNYISITTTPKDYLSPAFIYVSDSNDNINASPDHRNFSSQEIGTNVLYIYDSRIRTFEKEISYSVFISCLNDTEIELKVEAGKQVVLQDYPLGFKHKFNILMTSEDPSNRVYFEMTKPFEEIKKVLFYAIGEKIENFDFFVELSSDSGQKQIFPVKQMFENGYGSVVEITKDLFEGDDNPRISLTVNASQNSDSQLRYGKAEIGFEIIDNINNIIDRREVEILEHAYGMASNETCYKVKDIQNKSATMLINTFTPGVLFNIRDVNDAILYSLDVFNNYFIRLPKEFYEPKNYFCFKHLTPKESEEEVYGEVSYDFQIYYEEELEKYQMFLMPLLNGKIYTHSLNRGDIMIYRNNFFNGAENKKIYSANMLRIRGNPKLYGYTCNEYPNCTITSEDLKDTSKVEQILPLNMYHINKRLNAEGNTEIDKNGDAVYELRKQYMTIVSCESDETDPNNGECKYNIEINNEEDTIKLAPESVFATSIIPDNNNSYLINLKEYQSLKYVKIHFTVLTGNAELSLYTDSQYQNKLTNFNFTHIHRKEIFEINKDIKENYYIKVTCEEPSFIKIKYETNEDYKGYNNLMPNEINIEPINKNSNTYYNMFNPNYYYPLNEEERNNDFYYKIIPMECSMNCSDVENNYYDLKVFDFLSKRNKLYSYLSTYGFIGKAHEFLQTSTEEENCGIVIYNGEISSKRPLLVTTDMPLNSTLDNTYYIYPIIFDESKDNGIIIEFKIYNKEDSKEDDLYEIEILINEKKYETDIKKINSDQTIYIPKSAYENYFKENIVGNIYVNITKKYNNRKYYITTNFIGAKISPEYIYINQDYQFNLRPQSYKYFYGQISKDTEGQIKFKKLPKNIEIYSKIVKKDNIEDNNNWNGRVKLPTSEDKDLIEIKDSYIVFYKNMTSECDGGCEIYFAIDSSKITEENLIPLEFSFKEGLPEDYIEDLNYEETVKAKKDEMVYYTVKYTDTTSEGDIVVITTTPEKYTEPGYIYISKEDKPSIDNNNYISQTPGTNQIIINKKYFLDNEAIYLGIKPYADSKIKFKMSLEKEISLDDFPNSRAKLKFSDDYKISYKITGNLKKGKILIYSIAENYNYYNMSVQFTNKQGEVLNFEVKQMFEIGYGSVIDFNSDVIKDISNPKIEIEVKPVQDQYKDRKVEIGYEIIDNDEINEDKREVEILEHVYGMALNETCYKVKDIQNKSATMLINTFTQSVLFNIRNKNGDIAYSLDIFNNYFIRLPKEFYEADNYFCFKHITPKTSEEEVYGEVSYDFQIYYEDELSKYQMFIMPLIGGKIYTHSLNRGDIMIYRNNFYGDYTGESDIKIYSANMFRIRGNPKLYGYTCNEYPNCTITSEDLKDTSKVEQILPLNMYHINKRLNAEGNTEIDKNGDAVYELRKQYMTIVSCESDEADPNNGECKYNIEINNEMDEIQLSPESVFATSIVNPINYFLIRLKDYKTTKYLKLNFTVLTGNAELYIYDDFLCKHEFKDYNYSHIHRKEIIEINKDLLQNYYLVVRCTEPSFIQLKYETDAHYKGYDTLIPNEVNIVPINDKIRAYYNLYNPNYYYPFKDNDKNNDFYYNITTMDCSMHWGYIDTIKSNLTQYDFEQRKNVIYSYLSSYGFGSLIDKYTHTSFENENCGLIIYNGELSSNKPLLITSDMPHKSTFINTYYVYPIIYNEKTDEGIIIDFKIYNTGDLKDTFLYNISYYIEGIGSKKKQLQVKGNSFIFIDKEFYGDNLKNNMIGNLYISLNKLHSDKDYYITTNVMSSKISPEFLYPNQDYEFKLRPSSSKYFYSPINKDSDGYLKFGDFKNNKIKIYPKIVGKNEIEEGYNWNKRVKLPDENDPNLLETKDGVVAYYKNQTDKCTNGCELYFQIKSEESKLKNNLKISSDDLISISFIFKEEKYEKKDDIEPDPTPGDGGKNNYVWIIIVVVVAVVIIGVVILIVCLKKKRVYSSEIDKKDINELSMPLE